MGFLLDRLLAPRAAEHGPLDDYWYKSLPGGVNTQAGIAVTPDSALKVSTVYRCISLLSDCIAMLPIDIFKWTGEDSKEEARDHPLYGLLHTSPNQWQTAYEYKRMVTAHIAMRGNGISQIVPGKRGAVDQLIPIHPDRVTIWPSQDTGRVLYKIGPGPAPGVGVGTNARGQTLTQDEVWHLRDFSLDGVVGLSRIAQARENIGLSIAAETMAGSYFGNGAEPGIAIKYDRKVDPEVRERIKEEFINRHGGPFKYGGPIVMEGGGTIEKLALSNKDSQFLETRQFQVSDIARIFGIPPHLLGDTEKNSSWGTGIEQQTIGFLQFTLLPWLTMWEQGIAKDLIVANQLYYAKFDQDAMLRGDFKTRMEGYGVAIDRGVFNPNEVRSEMDYNPRKDGFGDKYLRSTNTVYADEPTVQPAAPQTPSNGKSVDVPPMKKGNGVPMKGEAA